MIRSLARQTPTALFLGCLALISSACREQPVAYREVPHETAPAPTASSPHGQMPGGMPGAMPGAIPTAAAGPALEWTAPAAWTAKPPSEMRLASYAFTASDGSVADISVFAFPDAAGGLLANINRWRGQVGLAPVSEDAIESTAQRTQIAGQASWLVDFAGTPNISAPAMGSTPPPTGLTRIVGAIVPISGRAWFFKMIGPDAVVVSQRANFQSLVGSIRAVTPSASTAAAGPAVDPHAGIPGAPAIGGAAMDPSAIAAPPSPPAGFTFETPAGWENLPGSQFRLASFKVPGAGVPPADVSVTNFPGTVGGDFANVNRWRAQLGLPALAEKDFAASVQRVAGRDGLEFVVAEMESTQPMIEGKYHQRLLAAILKQPGSTWFFKMTGETGHVADQREAFIRFLQSFHLEDGHAH